MVSSRVLDNKTLITVDSLVLNGLLDGPLANVCPFLLGTGCILLRVRGLPSLVPIVGELLKEVGLECSRLKNHALAVNWSRLKLLMTRLRGYHGELGWASRTYSECGNLVGNGGRSLLDVLGVDVARKHGSRHGRRDSVQLHDGRSDEIAQEKEYSTSLEGLRKTEKKKKTQSEDVQCN